MVPLAVSLTHKFYQTMQDFFFPKAEGEGQGQGELTESDHTHLFGPGGVQRTQMLFVNVVSVCNDHSW